MCSSLSETSGVVLGQANQSADSVALALLRQFPHKHLPKASDLEWLISELDAPQAVRIQPYLVICSFIL